MFGSFIRRTSFWVLDAIKGGKKKLHLNDIVTNKDSDYRAKLNNILEYARKNVPYYQAIPSSDLSAFPVMSKKRYRQVAEEAFLSRAFVGQELHTVFTSGSTGTPFKVVQDSDKRTRVIADLINCHNELGWHLGDRYVFIRNWVSNYKQSRLKSLMQNSHNINIAGFDDEKKNALTKWLLRHKHTIIFGYASAINEYACYLEKNCIDGKKLKVKLIVCDSDALTPAIKSRLNKMFCCPVYNRYDNEENGLLGISKADDDKLYLNTASLYFEILKLNSDEPVQKGEIGRVVITDLYNHAMPLIRYDTGDLACSSDDGHIMTLENLCGRSAGAITNVNGVLVSDVMISAIMEPFVSVEKYQLIQTHADLYTVKYIGILDDKSRQELLERFYHCLGSDAKVTFVCVSDIPKGKNGKYRSTINDTIT